jgi:hypothetical protein
VDPYTAIAEQEIGALIIARPTPRATLQFWVASGGG